MGQVQLVVTIPRPCQSLLSHSSASVPAVVWKRERSAGRGLPARSAVVESSTLSSYSSGGGQIISINKVRAVLYILTKLLGDVNAVAKGKVSQRVVRRAVGKVTSRVFSKWFR